MNDMWITPEQIKYRKDRNRKIGYALIPVGAIVVGALVAFATQIG